VLRFAQGDKFCEMALRFAKDGERYVVVVRLFSFVLSRAQMLYKFTA